MKNLLIINLTFLAFMILSTACEKKDEPEVNFATLVIGKWYTIQEFDRNGSEMTQDECERQSIIEFTTAMEYIVTPVGTYYDTNDQPYCAPVTSTPFVLTYSINGIKIINDFGEGTIERISNDMIILRSEDPFSHLILERVK
ncbi:lipocalin family protein [Belliella kenyensis]|uniref:Lipocalin family protein n=1 Tax=Belliella kenyensis TaxID=1472724 RepID=A0ABV8EN89_9BACT|nr:lipocalin family protein [Belliella kenyensis]MCH7400741.1 lipocalin family protein [Belliella kenyensis]MDN3601972.1 lipocalin family protein [Belliella kenyensis]